MAGLRLSVLDQSPDPRGRDRAPTRCATRSTSRRLADELGYQRYWVAEHHGTPDARLRRARDPDRRRSPPATERIRVGSGGVMLPHYSPLKVAETFSMLAGLHPERIDLGIGRAPGTDPMTMLALQRDRRQRRARRLPRAARRAARPAGGPASRPGHPSRGSPRRCPAGPSARALAARLLAAERDLGRASWACPTRSPTSSTPRARRSPPTTAAASSTPSGWPRRSSRSAWSRSAPRPTTEARAPGRLEPHDALAAPPGPADPDPAGGEGARLPGDAHAAAPAGAAAIVGAPATVRAGLEAVAAEYGAEEVDDPHDHPRPRGPPALLRAHRRRVRPGRAPGRCGPTP